MGREASVAVAGVFVAHCYSGIVYPGDIKHRSKMKQLFIVFQKMDFETAVKIVKSGTFSATDEDKLQLYALYKIAVGEVPSNGMTFKRRAMYAQWKLLVDTTDVKESRRAYIELVKTLI